MERKISWSTGCHDEIELVYEKAAGNEQAASLLAELEELALQEAENSCALLSVRQKPLTREAVCRMSAEDKETVMYHLSCIGLTEFNASVQEPVITVQFSAHIQSVIGCTMFSVLNRLEKIEGSYHPLLYPQAVLELQLPIGGKKGMVKWEMLLMLLYPWVSVREVSSGIAADGLPGISAAKPFPVQAESGQEKKPETREKKKGFFAKLFGKG